MADFNTLIADIRAAIYENTEQAITGDALQDILLEMVTDINTAKADQGDLDDLALAVAGKADNFSVDEYSGLYFDSDRVLNVNYHDVQAAIPDLAEIRQNAASPLHWLTGEAQEVEDGRIYTGTGILAAPGEFEVIKCYAVNYTDTAQAITCWRYPDGRGTAQTFTLAPFQVLALTCTIDEQQGSIWTAADSHYQRRPEVFVATYGTTTAAEIIAAYNEGKVVICNYINRTYVVSTISSGDYVYFGATIGDDIIAYLRVNINTNAWNYAQKTQEITNNKLTTAPTAADLVSTEKYPSMKTAADYIAATAACSTTIRNIVTLTQAEYDALADYDAHTFYIII